MRRIHSLDYLKVLLAVGVVFGHAILIQFQIVPWSYILGNGVLRSLVPTFSVLSGYCFFVTHSQGKTGRWLVGLILLYLFWIAFYVPIWFKHDTTLAEVVQVLFMGTMHLWYIAGLIVAAALLVGFLRLSGRMRNGNWPLLIAVLAAAVLTTVMSFWSFWNQPGLPLDVMRNGATVIFPFFAIGYLLARRVDARGLDSLPRAGALWPVVAVLFALKLVEAWVGMRAYGVVVYSPPEVPLLSYPTAILLFMAVLRTEMPKAPVNLSLWSASIYFLHIFLIFVIRHFGVNNLLAYVLFGVIGSVLIAVMMQQLLPFLRFGRLATDKRIRPH